MRAKIPAISMSLITVAACCLPCAAEDAKTSFSLVISAGDGKAQHLPLLPVVLTLELRNETLTTQSILQGFGAEDLDTEIDKVAPRFCFVVEGPDGLSGNVYYGDWVNWDWNRAPYALPQVLGPKENVRMDYSLGLGLPRPPAREMMPRGIHSYATRVFPKAGRYSIQLILSRLGTSGVRSNVLPIEIIEPTADQDKIAYEILSQSDAPEILIKASGARLAGPDPLLRMRQRGLWGQQLAEFQRQAFLAASRIVTECPNSAYAPYARLFWGHALAVGSVERLVDGKAPQTVDFARRAEGIGLLRQCGEDPALPVRYRQEALIALSTLSKRLDDSFRYQARVQLPTIASIVGPVDLRGVSEQEVLRNAYLLVKGAEATRASRERLLASRFTAEQIQRLKAVASTEPSIVQMFGGDALQQELQAHISWARAELDRIAAERPNYVRIQTRSSGREL